MTAPGAQIGVVEREGRSALPPLFFPSPCWERRRLAGILDRYSDVLAEFPVVVKAGGGLVLDGNEDLRGTFAEIARELASQYSIGYYPTGSKRDGKFRKVKVRTKDPDLRVRTRKGYYARRR